MKRYELSDIRNVRANTPDTDHWEAAAIDSLLAEIDERALELIHLRHTNEVLVEQIENLQDGAPIWKRLAAYTEELEKARTVIEAGRRYVTGLNAPSEICTLKQVEEYREDFLQKIRAYDLEEKKS